VQRNRNTATAPVHSQKPKCQNTECRSALWIGVAQEGSSRVRSNKDSLKKIPTSGNSVTNDQIQNNCAANRFRRRPFHAHQQLHNIPIARKPAAERPRSSWSRRTPKTSWVCCGTTKQAQISAIIPAVKVPALIFAARGSQMPPQICGERQHQQSCQRKAAGSHPIMTGIITRRKQVGDDAVSPVVILGEHPRARTQRSEKRKENQHQQDSQS
jgi:hypothetical protein